MHIFKDKNIVITGGSGFIGSNLAKMLCSDNEVTILDNFATGRRSNIEALLAKKKVRLVKGTILSQPTLHHAFKGCDYVIHEGAIPSAPRSVKDPITSNEANILGTLNVLLAAHKCGVEKVVCAVSSSAYGDTPTLPKVEAMPPNPLSPYANTKLACEYYCKVFNDLYGLRTTALRYFNVYGPNQNPKSEYAAVIPKFITCVMRGESPLVYGDGTQSRDFTFVADAAAATILACMSKKADGEVMNIATGKRVVLNDLLTMICRSLKKNVAPTYTKERPGDVKHSLADISKAKRLLGYAPKYTINTGLPATIEYFKNTEGI